MPINFGRSVDLLLQPETETALLLLPEKELQI